MREFKGDKLRSSSGARVKSRDQAVAIALSMAGLREEDRAKVKKRRS